MRVTLRWRPGRSTLLGRTEQETMNRDEDAGRFRLEHDALGDVQVRADHLWGAQTERSIHNFPIGVDRYRWGRAVIRAFGVLKKCAALANEELGQLSHEKADWIARAKS